MRTTQKQVIEQIREHIGEYYTMEELRQQLKAFDYLPNNYNIIIEMAQGGAFLCYHSDVRDFLNGLGVNPNNKEYDTAKSWELYKHLIAREAVKMLEKMEKVAR